jgi:hypothetical protein
MTTDQTNSKPAEQPEKTKKHESNPESVIADLQVKFAVEQDGRIEAEQAVQRLRRERRRYRQLLVGLGALRRRDQLTARRRARRVSKSEAAEAKRPEPGNEGAGLHAKLKRAAGQEKPANEGRHQGGSEEGS